MHKCSGFLKYKVIYYYSYNENCHDNDKFINTFQKLINIAFILIIALIFININAASFHLGFIVGEKGSTGEDGLKGVKGDMGEKGTNGETT